MLRASFPIFEICLWPSKDTCLIFSTTAEKAAIVNAIICDASLKETMNTTVEKDATANDISDESKDKKREILPRYYIFNTLFFSDWLLQCTRQQKSVDHARFLISYSGMTERKEINCLPVEAIDEVAVSAVSTVTKDIAIDEAEEKGDEVFDLSQEMTQCKSILYLTS